MGSHRTSATMLLVTQDRPATFRVGFMRFAAPQYAAVRQAGECRRGLLPNLEPLGHPFRTLDARRVDLQSGAKRRRRLLAQAAVRSHLVVLAAVRGEYNGRLRESRKVMF